jgi:uncharacterized membrane protein YphA (DoxX/SURF4 family)
MDSSIAHPPLGERALELPAWKTILAVISAVLLGFLFIVSGVWKIMEPVAWAARLTQMRFPGELAQPATLAVGVLETFGGVLLFVPRFRRWGAWITGILLVVFMIYVGANYNALRGEECSCFPWVKRAVGPGFFIGDLVMLAAALAAGYWSRASEGLRNAGIVLAALSVFAVASLGVNLARNSGAPAPAQITVVDGQAAPNTPGRAEALGFGKVFLYFFDPECSHCFEAAQKMGKLNWGATRVIAIPTINPQFGPGFLKDTGLKANLSPDLELLKKHFPFVAGPFGVALENGRAKAQYINFDANQPYANLKELGFTE